MLDTRLRNMLAFYFYVLTHFERITLSLYTHFTCFFYVLKHAESNRNIKHTWISFHAICNDPLDVSSFNFLQRIYHISQCLFRKFCSQHVKQQHSATRLSFYSTSEPDMKRCVYFRDICQMFPVFDNAMGCLVKFNS